MGGYTVPSEQLTRFGIVGVNVNVQTDEVGTAKAISVYNPAENKFFEVELLKIIEKDADSELLRNIQLAATSLRRAPAGSGKQMDRVGNISLTYSFGTIKTERRDVRTGKKVEVRALAESPTQPSSKDYLNVKNPEPKSFSYGLKVNPLPALEARGDKEDSEKDSQKPAKGDKRAGAKEKNPEVLGPYVSIYA